jgi:hypothetical protein
MKRRWWLIAGAVSILLLAGGLWLAGDFVGRPDAKPSPPLGTSRRIHASEIEASNAITNAFKLFRYKGMMLTTAIGSDWLAPGWHATGGYLLIPAGGPIATIRTKGPFGRRELHYMPTFNIQATTVCSNETVITVHTVTAKVLDGLTVGHSGIVPNTFTVPAVQQEEDRVIDAIADHIEQHGRRP